MKLPLSSVGPSSTHDAALEELVGSPLAQTRVGYIEDASDVYDDEPTLVEGRESRRLVGP